MQYRILVLLTLLFPYASAHAKAIETCTVMEQPANLQEPRQETVEFDGSEVMREVRTQLVKGIKISFVSSITFRGKNKQFILWAYIYDETLRGSPRVSSSELTLPTMAGVIPGNSLSFSFIRPNEDFVSVDCKTIQP